MKNSRNVDAENMMENIVRLKWGWFVRLGLVTLFLGTLAFRNLTLAANISVFYVGIFMALIASGAVRIWSSLRFRSQSGCGWILSSAIMTLAAGIIFMVDWPVSSLRLLGMVLAVDLTFQGITMLMVGLNLYSSKTSAKIYSRAVTSVY